MRPTIIRGVLSAGILCAVGLMGTGSGGARELPGIWQAKVDPALLRAAEKSETEFLVVLRQQGDISGANALPTKQQKGQYVYESLTRIADSTQADLVVELDAAGVSYRRFWITNALWVRAAAPVVEMLARHTHVAAIHANPRIRMDIPRTIEDAEPPLKSDRTVEWNLELIDIPAVWADGNRGQGAVIGGLDTGYDWQHPALIQQYRGWDGSAADHDYNWHDAIHSGGGACGPDSPLPCDDGLHGTHTMGIMVGDDGDENQIGLAPAARWIGCRCMDEGFGTPATYMECLQWMVAPTDLVGNDPDPARAPDVINNSWVCPPFEGCEDPNVLRNAVINVRAAGIVVVASAGNSGSSGCGSVFNPPAIYNASFTVGSTDSEDLISTFSSRGPVIVDGSSRLKPDVCAPGQLVRASIPDGEYASLSGTSMAGPHTAGLVALLVSANPRLSGATSLLEGIIMQTAVPKLDSEDCGGIPGSQVPNNTYGHGRIDAWSAHLLAMDLGQTSVSGTLPRMALLRPNLPNPFNPKTLIRYELPERSRVTLRVFDARGRLLRELLRDQMRGPGPQAELFDGRDRHGRHLASGVYFAVLDDGRTRQMRRMALIR